MKSTTALLSLHNEIAAVYFSVRLELSISNTVRVRSIAFAAASKYSSRFRYSDSARRINRKVNRARASSPFKIWSMATHSNQLVAAEHARRALGKTLDSNSRNCRSFCNRRLHKAPLPQPQCRHYVAHFQIACCNNLSWIGEGEICHFLDAIPADFLEDGEVNELFEGLDADSPGPEN